MPASPEWIAGYRSAVHHVWAAGRRRPRDPAFAWLDDRTSGAPDGASEEFLKGWRDGIDAAAR